MKITESQLKQIIRKQIANVLKEVAEVRQPTLVGTTTFGELKKADMEAARARGNYQDPETGKTYPATSVFQRTNMSIKDNAKVDIFQSVFQFFTAILNPDGDGALQYVIGRDTVQRLNLKPAAKQVQGAAKSAGGATAGLPPRNVAEAKLRAIIKKELSEVLQGTPSPAQIFTFILQKYQSYVPLFKEQPKNVESLKNSLKDLLQSPQNGVKNVIAIEPPTIQNGMIYGSFVEFVAVDGKRYKFNYAPSVSTLVDVQTHQVVYRN